MWVAVAMLVACIAIPVLQGRLNWQWLCRVMNWHTSPQNHWNQERETFELRCSRCQKRVLFDSQGNWFAVE